MSLIFADTINTTEGFQQADPSSTLTPGPALDSGIGGTGIIMNNQENDTSNIGGENSGKRLDNLIGSSINGKRNKKKNFISEIPDGNFDTAVEEFDNLGLKNVKPLSGDVEGKSGETDDGRRVIVRNRSREGRPTIQVTVVKLIQKGLEQQMKLDLVKKLVE